MSHNKNCHQNNSGLFWEPSIWNIDVGDNKSHSYFDI